MSTGQEMGHPGHSGHGARYCPQCGVELPPDAGFCGACGNKIDVPQPPPQQPVAPYAAQQPEAPNALQQAAAYAQQPAAAYAQQPAASPYAPTQQVPPDALQRAAANALHQGVAYAPQQVASPYAPQQAVPAHAPPQPPVAYAPQQPVAPYAPQQSPAAYEPQPVPGYAPPPPPYGSQQPQPDVRQAAQAYPPTVQPDGYQSSAGAAAEPGVEPFEPPRRAREVLRRLLTAAMLFVAFAAFFYRPESFFQVELEDWPAEYLKESSATVPITQFIDGRLRGSASPVEEPAWSLLAEQVQQEGKRATGSPTLFFASDHPLLADRAGLVVVQEAGRRRYLLVSSRRTSSYTSGIGAAPSWRLISPLALYGIPFLLFAAVPYIVVRWKPGYRDTRYKTWVTVFFDAPGFLIVCLAGVAFGRLVAEGFFSAVLAAAGVLLVSMAFVLPSLYYACLRAFVLPDRVRVTSLLRTRDFPFDQIQSAMVQRERQAPVLGIIMVIIGLTNLVMIPVGLVLIFKEDLRFTLRRTDGSTFRIWVRSSEGVMEELVPALSSAGVRITGSGM